MSALFKLVLGQRVVHPDASKRKVEGEGGPNGETAVKAGSSPSPAATNGISNSPGPSVDNRLRASADAAALGAASAKGCIAVDSEAANSMNAVAATKSATTAAAASSLTASKPSSASTMAQASSSPRPSTPTRTLLLRIEGCTVAQDIRDALRDLLRCPDLPYALDETSLRSVTALLTSYGEDESITEPTLRLLATATNIDAYPSQLELNRRTVEVTMADKRHTRDELLQTLVEVVPLLLEAMNTTAPFWSRYFAAVLLQRLEEYEPSRVNQALLAARGVGVLLDALNETEHDNALRNEALHLLTSLTLADRELQTLLAFDNAFDSLFDLVQREGGVLGGGAVVRDSLTVVQNILRSNKATQKFFREMGCASRLAALFDSIPTELSACTVAEQRRGNASSSPTHWPLPTVQADKLEGLLERLKHSDVMLNVLMSVSILASVLRGSEDSDDDFHATQDALLRCGLLNPLTRLAFCGLTIDDATRIEAVRVLALLLDRSKRAMEEWLGAPPMLTLVRATLPFTVRVWPAPRALLSYVCETTDTTLVNAGVQLFLSVLSVPACQERAVSAFLGGLVGDSGTASTTSGPAAPLVSSSNSNNSSDRNSIMDPHCGSALARILLSPTASAVEKYYTAQVFRTLISIPVAARLSESLVRVAVPVELQQGKLDRLVKAQPGWVLSSHLSPSFFNYYVSFLLFAISGGAASQQLNTSALGAYVAALLAWTGACPWAAAALVQEISWGDTLLYQARRDGAAHLRLWSAMLIARGCVVVRAAAAAASGKSTPHLKESATAAAGTALVQRFLQTVGGGAALDTILFDAQASTPAWQHPVASGLRTQSPTPYDEPFVSQVEQLVQEFKQLLSTVAGASPKPSVSLSLPPLNHLAPPRGVAQPLPPTAPSSSVSLHLSQHGSSNEGQQLSLQETAQQQHTVLSTSPTVFAPSTNILPSGSAVLSQAAPLASLTTRAEDDVSAMHVRPDGEASALIESLQAQLHAARSERASLMHAMDEWRSRAEQSEARCLTLQKEEADRAAALAAAEAEITHHREMAAAAHASTVSADMVEGLRENVRLLEEALSSKDEEHQQLVQSLSMMEEQLRSATNAAAAANDQRAAAVAAAAQQQQQRQASPPTPQGPPPELLAKMEAERNALQHQLAGAQQETGRLQHALQHLTADYQELLLMVAELNEECVSVKAFSSTAPTPARQVADWPSASPSVDREREDAAASRTAETVAEGAPPPSLNLPCTAVVHAPGGVTVPHHKIRPPTEAEVMRAEPYAAVDSMQTLESSLPVEMAGQRGRTVESPSTQLAEIARTASSTAYAEATDVFIDPTASQPTPPLPASHHHHARHAHISHDNNVQHLEYTGEFRTPSQSASSQHAVVTPTQQPFAPPPPPSAPPHPHRHGGLPNPMQGRQSVLHPGSRHGPRYANPAEAFFNSGAAKQQAALLAAPPPPMPAAAGTGLTWATQDSPPAYQADTPSPPSAQMPMEPFRVPSALVQPDGKGKAVSDVGYEVLQPSGLPSQSTPMPRPQLDTVRATGAQLDAAPASEEFVYREPYAVLAPQALHVEQNEAPCEAPPLPSADDVFGGVGDVAAGLAANAFAMESPQSYDDEPVPAPALEAYHQPPPPQHTGEDAPKNTLALNPFLSNSAATNSDRIGAVLTASTTSDKALEGHYPCPKASITALPVPAPSLHEQQEMSGSLSVKSDRSRADTTLPPPPPMPHKYPMSALSGSAHHLNYKGGAVQGAPQPQPTQQSSGNAAAPISESEPRWSECSAVAAPPSEAAASPTEAEKPVNDAPQSVTMTYNPFADFGGGDDEADDLANLR
jgi:hypothetical protein